MVRTLNGSCFPVRLVRTKRGTADIGKVLHLMNNMRSSHHLQTQHVPAYDPDRLLNEVAKELGAADDAALSKKLNISRAVLSHIRRRHLSVTPSFLMWLHEATGMQIQKLRDLLGDRRRRVRASGQYRFGTSS